LTYFAFYFIVTYTTRMPQLKIQHVTRPANVPVPVYLASRPLHALISIRLNAKVLTKTDAALTSRSSLFPRVHILQFVAGNTFVFNAFLLTPSAGTSQSTAGPQHLPSGDANVRFYARTYFSQDYKIIPAFSKLAFCILIWTFTLCRLN